MNVRPNHRHGAWIIATLLLAAPALNAQAAAQMQRVQAVTKPAAKKPAAVKPVKPAKTAPAKVAAVSETAQSTGLTGEMLNQYLLAEIAGQRGDYGLAQQMMLALAKSTRDLKITQRAAELAFQSRQTDAALEATILWLTLEPEATRARQALGLLIGNQGSLATTSSKLESVLKDETHRALLFMHVAGLLSRYPDKSAVAESAMALAAPYPRLAEAHYAVAQAANAARNPGAALAAIREALAIKPGWATAAVLQGQILRNTSDETAEKYLHSFLEKYPDATEARVTYARLLVVLKDYTKAREEFGIAARAAPDDIEMPFAIGLLSQQLDDNAEAEKQFKHALEMSPRDSNPIKYNLGSVAEARKDTASAMDWYKQINSGEYFIGAQIRVATILQQQQGMDAARKYLQEVQESEADSDETRNQLILAESQLLREAKLNKEAYTLLGTALEKSPESLELLYDHAMLAAKVDRLDILETDLRKVISLKPDHAHALNALGYTLADRTNRLDEAMVLIQRAIMLSPNDPFIQDSLGWVQYRMGRANDALQTLQDAYRAKADPEIAAHLGVVMWGSGKKQEALKLWQAALLDHPDSDELQSVMQKYRP